MKKKYTVCILSLVLAVVPVQHFYAAGFFNGYAGMRADISFTNSVELALKSFFAGQFNITKNFIARAEFTLSADNLFDPELFTGGADAKFQIDEISLIFRRQFLGGANYLSAFVGTYEPVGSDIFLRRQFGIQPIASKITESWLGLSGSIVYPRFNMGISDVVHFSGQPISAGAYIYFNRNGNNTDRMDFNGDIRFACAYQYFYVDVVTGINAPFTTTDKVYLLVESLYGHAGMIMLVGNNYTPVAFFFQGGIYYFPFKRNKDFSEYTIKEHMYLLSEVRSNFSSFQLSVAAFSIPQKTVDTLLFLRDPLGINISFSNNALHAGTVQFELGVHTTLSFPDKYFTDLIHISDFFDTMPTLTLAPYMAMRMSSGEMRVMFQLDATALANEQPAKAFKINVGYKAQF
ncbi:MAG: hypothetical protein J6I73_01135 [Treponema sp.]|nr:hypothetical protein [Treponema sp.]